MIDLKNRTREELVYQYQRGVSAGPVRPHVAKVHRGRLNPKTGERTLREQQATFGGVLTLPAQSTLMRLPDALLTHPKLQRDIAANRVRVHQYATTTAPSVAPTERARSRKTKEQE